MAECTLDIGGMTCASCVGRVQKALTRVEGVVTATVNLANETAVVTYDPAATGTQAMASAVEKAGYTGTPRTPAPGPRPAPPPHPSSGPRLRARGSTSSTPAATTRSPP